MRFRSLLTHNCSLLTPGQVTGTDDYGRDIISIDKQDNIPCRVDKIRQSIGTDENGTDFVYINEIYFEGNHGITLDTEITNIRDKRGNPVLQGSFSVLQVLPLYNRSKLHHYQVTVQRK